MKEKILNATHGGLDIILSYYPQARACIEKKQKHFKIREECTASASLIEFNGIWYVKDFGAPDDGGNCFDIAMREENLTFNQVLSLLAEHFNVDCTLKESINKPTIAYRPTNNSDVPFSYVTRKPTKVELDVFGPFVTEEVLKEYNYHALESYSIIKGTQVITFSSNDNYPIFMHDCGEFKKIYKPLEFNKEYRFFTSGQKPRDYVNGLDIVRLRFQSLQRESSKSEKSAKLPEIIICSGERDAMNVAGLDYLPVWFNSETANIDASIIHELLKMAERVYNIPDIDETGLRAARALALKHLVIYTVQLPQWLKLYRDNRGRPRKDLRDYFDLQRNPNDFASLLSTASQCKFWTLVKEVNGHRKYSIRHTSLLCYLNTNGFCKYRDESCKRIRIVHIDGFKVKECDIQDVRDFIRNDLIKRQIDTYVLDAFLMSKKTTTSVTTELDIADIDFSKSTNDSRTLFFKNTAVRVTDDKVELLADRDIKQFTWEENISPHDFTRINEAFQYQINQNGSIDFTINHTQSHLFCMMINASRIYWREEFEHRVTGNVQEDKAYAETYKFSINGPRLKLLEINEHNRHLLNKIYALGYQLHCHKVRSKALALWMMENKVTGENESSGGSGKSFFANVLADLNLVNITTLEGRNRKLTDNAHALDRVTSNTDIILVDDAYRNFDFDSFYSMITGGVTVNPKGEKSFEIKFDEDLSFLLLQIFQCQMTIRVR